MGSVTRPQKHAPALLSKMLASLGRALTLSLSVLAAASSTAARSAYGQGKLLVVTDSKTTAAPREEYSKFWSSLEERGYSLTFRDARNTKPEPSELLTRFEEKQYDGLVLFAPAMKSSLPIPHCPIQRSVGQAWQCPPRCRLESQRNVQRLCPRVQHRIRRARHHRIRSPPPLTV